MLTCEWHHENKRQLQLQKKIDPFFSSFFWIMGTWNTQTFAIGSLSSSLHPASQILVRIIYGIASLEAKTVKRAN